VRTYSNIELVYWHIILVTSGIWVRYDRYDRRV